MTGDRVRVRPATAALHISGIEILVGVRVWLCGFQFDLVAAGVLFGMPMAMKEASYRPAGLSSASSNVLIEFEWRNGPQSPAVVFEYLGGTTCTCLNFRHRGDR